jgi:VWFA-related protein
MTRRAAAVVLALLPACVWTVGVSPQERFRSTAELVTVDVLVTDGRRLVTGLTVGDFELLDSGVPQTIRELYLDELPMTVIMVLDTSGSVEGERLEALRRAALAVIDRLRPDDRAAVVSFSRTLRMREDVTSDAARLRSAVAALQADGATALRDAAYAGLALAGAEAGRTLVLLFTDGVDTASLLDDERVLSIARQSSATVYTVAIREVPDVRLWDRSAPPPATDDRFVRGLAQQTGGRVMYAERNRDIGPAFERVLAEFKSRYVLGSGQLHLFDRISKRFGILAHAPIARDDGHERRRLAEQLRGRKMDGVERADRLDREGAANPIEHCPVDIENEAAPLEGSECEDGRLLFFCRQPASRARSDDRPSGLCQCQG